MTVDVPRIHRGTQKGLKLRSGVMQANKRAIVNHFFPVCHFFPLRIRSRLGELKHELEYGRAGGEDRFGDAEDAVLGT
jgi:hypothetical protein